MDEFKTVIHSKEKSEAKGLYIGAIFLLIPALGSFFSALIKGSGAAAILGTVFLIFALLLYVFGSFKSKKYKQLGITPLTLTPSYCTIGKKASGSIIIEREQFKKVTELSLKCWKTSPSGSDSGSMRYDVVWQTTMSAALRFSGSQTILDFEFIIPEGERPTNECGSVRNKFHWEMRLEFVEKMDRLTRTWKIPVKA